MWNVKTNQTNKLISTENRLVVDRDVGVKRVRRRRLLVTRQIKSRGWNLQHGYRVNNTTLHI